jgi:hypothetical protein
LRVDDHARGGFPVDFLRAGEEIRAELDEVLPELADAVGGELAAVLVLEQFEGDWADALVDPREAGK